MPHKPCDLWTPDRLKDARDGDVMVRPGLISEAPSVRLDPIPLSVHEGGLAQFKVVAAVSEDSQWWGGRRGRGSQGKASVGMPDRREPPLSPLTPVQGLEPLRYQWFKDDRKLAVATSDSPLLIVPEVAALDAGQYHCQVSGGARGGGAAAKKPARGGVTTP